jgi:hypothetical protein
VALKFAHIINPFNPRNSPTEAKVQAITAECMRRAAREYGENNVTLVSAQYAEDLDFVPEGFIKTENLTRSFQEVSGIPSHKKLPLIGDITGKLTQFTDADYYIYTNTDISPLPFFYSAVASILEKSGCDALIINRRRIPEELIDSPIEVLFSEKGESHPGYDCFVFKRELLPKLDFGNVAVGIPGIGFLFAHNLFLFANSCKVLYDLHLTFHLGMEIVKSWSSKKEVKFQHREIYSFLQKNKSKFDVSKFPGYNFPFFKRHFRWLMNPLFLYPMMFQMDMKKLGDGRKIVRHVNEEIFVSEFDSQKMNFNK